MSENKIDKFRKNLEDPDLSKFSTKVSAKKLTSLEIGVFGEAGAGKSTFINTAIKSFKKTDEVLPFANADTRNTLLHGTKNYEEFSLQDGDNNFRISMYDSRGFNFINEEEELEIFGFIFGFGSTGYMSRRKDVFSAEDQKLLDMYGPEFQNNKTGRPLNAVILCVSSTSSDEVLKKMERVLNCLRTIQFNSFMVVVTKTKAETKDAAMEKVAAALNLGKEKIKVINSYTERYPAYNAECENAAIEILHECLVLAATSPEFKLSWWKRLRLTLKQHQNTYHFLSKNWQSILIAVLALVIMLMWMIYVPGKVDTTSIPKGKAN